MRGLLLVISIVVLLMGCGQPKASYDRPGATPAMFERESEECKSWAQKAAIVKSGPYSPFSRDMGMGTGPQAAQGSFEAGDEDQYYRKYHECLQLKGWKQVPKPQR